MHYIGHLSPLRLLLLLGKCMYITFGLHLDLARVFKGYIEQIDGLIYRDVSVAVILINKISDLAHSISG
jgi:hypothetical protein